MRRAQLVLALFLAAGMAGVASAQAKGPAPAPAAGPAPADSFARFLEDLNDSTDAFFGASSVEFDTTGLDTLTARALDRPPVLPRARVRASTFPVLGYHRALGATVGAGHRHGLGSAGTLDLRGSYATGARLGRYAFAWRRTLWSPGGPLPAYQAMRAGRIGERTRLDLDLRYARENLAFMPEHADPDFGATGALISGSGAQSIYEARGASGGLTLWTGDWRFGAGVRDAREKPLPVTTRFSLLGDEDSVEPNTAAAADRFTEPFAGVAFFRSDWELGGVLDARGGGGDRWRVRAALGKALRLGGHLKATTQLEAGAAAARAPRQRRFELGGARAVPTLAYGRGGTDHLLLGRTELLASPDVLDALGLPHPRWLVLQPSLFVDYGNAWDDPAGRDVLLSSPPGAGWRGSAGGGFAWRLGVPEPDVMMRLWMAWPIGPRAGVPSFNMSVGRAFDLVGRL